MRASCPQSHKTSSSPHRSMSPRSGPRTIWLWPGKRWRIRTWGLPFNTNRASLHSGIIAASCECLLRYPPPSRSPGAPGHPKGQAKQHEEPHQAGKVPRVLYIIITTSRLHQAVVRPIRPWHIPFQSTERRWLAMSFINASISDRMAVIHSPSDMSSRNCAMPRSTKSTLPPPSL